MHRQYSLGALCGVHQLAIADERNATGVEKFNRLVAATVDRRWRTVAKPLQFSNPAKFGAGRRPSGQRMSAQQSVHRVQVMHLWFEPRTTAGPIVMRPVAVDPVPQLCVPRGVTFAIGQRCGGAHVLKGVGGDDAADGPFAQLLKCGFKPGLLMAWPADADDQASLDG